jgi:hypothetical protein
LLTPQFQFVHPACAERRGTVGKIDIGAYERGGRTAEVPPECNEPLQHRTCGCGLAILPGAGTNPASPIAPCQKILLAKVRFVRIDHRDHHPRTKALPQENHVLTLFVQGINRF